MTATILRSVRDDDWDGILALATASVAHVPEAGSQEEWHRNRRQFDERAHVRRQFVAVPPEDGSLLGYGAVESQTARDFRLFVVTRPNHLATVGALLYDRAMRSLYDLGARGAWCTEYARDEPLLEFFRARDFREVRRFPVAPGVDAVTLAKKCAW